MGRTPRRHAPEVLDSMRVLLELWDELRAQPGPFHFTLRGVSMWPAVPDGSLLAISPCDASLLRPGELVLFRRAGTLVVHRLVQHLPDGRLSTWGDAVLEPDSLVSPADVLGRATLVEPGPLVDGLRTPLLALRRLGATFARARVAADTAPDAPAASEPSRSEPATAHAELASRLLADTHLRAAAREVLDALEQAGVRAAPLKGLVVSARLYDDPLQRRFGDADVLVSRADLRRALGVARARGHRLVYDSKQLGNINFVVPPGLPVDVRSSLGPPGLSALSAETVLHRARRSTDLRVVGAPFWELDPRDHLLLLFIDAAMDKLHHKADRRLGDLTRAVAAWMGDPTSFALHARGAGLAVLASVVLDWLGEKTSDPLCLEARRALEPLPMPAAFWAGAVGESLRRDPDGAASRVGVRLLCDSPLRAAETLALGGLGTLAYRLRHGSRDPWRGVLWRGP